MIIKGCTDDVHHTRDATEHVNCSGSQIIFSWAMAAGQLEFPPGAGIHVGGRSGIKSIAIEAHYKDAFHGVDNLTGVELEFTTEPPQKTVGIYLLASATFQLPPKQRTNVHIGCKFRRNPIEVFAFRAHTHEKGRVVSAYLRRPNNENWTLIGKGNPNWPQGFFTRIGGPITIHKWDSVRAICTFDNNDDHVVRDGPNRDDEMCNMYLMYTIPYTFVPNKAPQCWNNADKIMNYPKNLIESEARFPGDAGDFSDKHIAMGHVSRPAIPEMMSHAHHKMGGKEEEQGHVFHFLQEEHDYEITHNSMSHEEHTKMVHGGHH